MSHRFAIEALASAMLLTEKRDPLKQVVGTGNTRKCELYGWAPCVDSHRDATGFVYLVTLNGGTTSLAAFQGDDVVEVFLPPGAVVRLDDHLEHWTTDSGPRVAAFVGSYEEADDAGAIEILRGGIEALARGDYYGAPRVRPGFRAMLDDECHAMTGDGQSIEMVLIEDAQAQDRIVVPCTICGRPACRVDEHWPYHTERSRCREHLHREVGGHSLAPV